MSVGDEFLVQRRIDLTPFGAPIRFADVHPRDRNADREELLEHPVLARLGKTRERRSVPDPRYGGFLVGPLGHDDERRIPLHVEYLLGRNFWLLGGFRRLLGERGRPR